MTVQGIALRKGDGGFRTRITDSHAHKFAIVAAGFIPKGDHVKKDGDKYYVRLRRGDSVVVQFDVQPRAEGVGLTDVPAGPKGGGEAGTRSKSADDDRNLENRVSTIESELAGIRKLLEKLVRDESATETKPEAKDVAGEDPPAAGTSKTQREPKSTADKSGNGSLTTKAANDAAKVPDLTPPKTSDAPKPEK